MANETRQQFIEEVADAAMEQMRLHGIPASITIAQAIIESGDGKSRLAQTANNNFGIKGKYKGEYVLANDDKPNEKFRKYEDVSQSFEDHSRVLLNERYQKHVGHLGLDDYEGWARGIAAGGYATASNYAGTLIGVIEASNLQKYDQMVIEQMRKEGKEVATKATVTASRDERKPTGLDLPAGQYSMPVKRNEFMLVTSPYGMRKDPMDRSCDRFHYGIDIQTNSDAVLATENNGKVVAVNHSTNTGGGKSVTVQYDRADGSKTLVEYMHLSVIDVKQGDSVNAGQKLGISGNTGTRTTGEHLHFGVYSLDSQGKKVYMDPSAYLCEINEKGNLHIEANDRNGEDLLARYKPGGKVENDERLARQTDGKSEDRKEASDELTPENWAKKLLGSTDSALGLGLLGADGGGIIETLMSMMMSLLFLSFDEGKKSDDEKRKEVTDAAIDRRVDISRYVPNLKSAEMSVKSNGTVVLTTSDGRNVYNHTLTDAERERLTDLLDSDVHNSVKAQRLGLMVTAITFSQQASQNFDQILEQQRGQDQTIQRR